ncbi:hypothetical protein ACINK0_11545 [Deinococcus sp. VB343]|uniref:hypothetical protein n=1 Tax=Deinococcus sp. VB343 TaxID=3385567 RepID=UPI0039C9F7BD
MKKILLASVAGAGLLASCGNGSVIVETNPVTNLKVTSYTTNWQLTTEARDQNGQPIAKGAYLICDNRNTTMAVGATWQGGLQQLALQFKGYNTGATKTVATNPLGATNSTGSGTYEYTFGPETAPLNVGSGKISAQAIVVNPITTVNVKGYTYVRIQGYDVLGNPSNIAESEIAIPVADCAS